jgi:hypothetical protein
MDEKIDRADIAWPIVDDKDDNAPSVFQPEPLLREARRQKQLPLVAVPEICVLDRDGDVVRHIKRKGSGRTHEGWACYHTAARFIFVDAVSTFPTGGTDSVPATSISRARSRMRGRTRCHRVGGDGGAGRQQSRLLAPKPRLKQGNRR